VGAAQKKGAAVRARVLAVLLAAAAMMAQESEMRSALQERYEPERGGFASEEDAVHEGTGERLARTLNERGVPVEAVVLMISTLPIVELRGAVPAGIMLQMPWWKAVLLSVIGNMLPIFLILLLLDRAVGWLGHIRLFRRFFDWLFARTRRKSGLIERYEFLGLMLFVAIPLPITGAWTGSVAAVIMGIPYWRAMLAIFLGVCIAGAVVTMLSLLGVWGALIAGVALAAVLANAVVSSIRRRKPDRQPK
jgi:uncharacterized membrane protein